MSEKQMEKNLQYGDCFNFFGLVFGSLVEALEVKEVDKKDNSKYYSNSRRHTLIARECKGRERGALISLSFLLRNFRT